MQPALRAVSPCEGPSHLKKDTRNPGPDGSLRSGQGSQMACGPWPHPPLQYQAPSTSSISLTASFPVVFANSYLSNCSAVLPTPCSKFILLGRPLIPVLCSMLPALPLAPHELNQAVLPSQDRPPPAPVPPRRLPVQQTSGPPAILPTRYMAGPFPFPPP